MGHRPPRSRFDTGASLRTSLQAEGASRRGIAVLQSMVAQRLAPGGMLAPEIRTAVVGGPRALAVRTGAMLARRVFGAKRTQVQAIARQTAARPAVRIGAATGLVVGAERAIEAATGRSPARMVFDLTQRSRRNGRPPIDPFGPVKKIQESRMPGRNGMSPSHQPIKQWQTFPGGPVFTRFEDGHIEVTRKNGTVRHYRPYRPVVIPKNWNARAMGRVATALKRQRKTATKILQLTGGVPKKTVRVAASPHRSVDV